MRGLDHVTPRLAELGFRKRAGSVFTIELAPNILGWLGLNTATRHLEPGGVEVNPVIGARHQDIERVVAELQGDKFHPYQPPTISAPLGYLLPESRYVAWVFTPGREEPVVTDMVAAIRAYALPFMRSVTDVGDFSRTLQERGRGIEDQLVYRRPVAFFLAGDEERARRMLEDSLQALGSRSDASALAFREFGERLRSRFRRA